MAGWGSLIRIGLGGGGRVEWDIPTDVTDSCLDKGRAQMEYRNQSSQAMKSCLYPLKNNNNQPHKPPPSLQSTLFPPLQNAPTKNTTPTETEPPKPKTPKKNSLTQCKATTPPPTKPGRSRFPAPRCARIDHDVSTIARWSGGLFYFAIHKTKNKK